jgi:pectinesterase
MASLIGSINGRYPIYQTDTYASFSDRVQAVVDVDGVLAFIHPESGEGADKQGKLSAGTLWFGVSSLDDPTSWTEASALTHAGPQSAPFLFINSAQPRFHAGQADMINILNANDIHTEAYLLPDTPHSFWLFHPWVDTTMHYVVQFLDNVLK